MDILDSLSQNNYIVYNKKLAKEIWINETIIFMYFVSQYKRFEWNWQLSEDWYFYKTADDIYDNTWLSRKQQKLAIDNIRDIWLIDYKVKWQPPTLHFTIFRDKLLTLFSSHIDERSKCNLPKCKNVIYPNGKLLPIYNNNIINIPFISFRDLYWKKVWDKNKCEKKWNKLKDEERKKIIETLPYRLKNIKDKTFQPHPMTYLNQQRWNDELKIRQFVKLDKKTEVLLEKEYKPMTEEEKEKAKDILQKARWMFNK